MTDEVYDYYDIHYDPDVANLLAESYIADSAWGTPFDQYADEFLGAGLSGIDAQSFFDDDRKDGVFKIGCDFQGVLQIQPYEDDDIFIPSSYYCAYKCYEKFYNRKFNYERETNFGVSIPALKKFLDKQKIDWGTAPRILRWGKNSRGKEGFIPTNTKHKSTAKQFIALIKLKGNYYHAVLLKQQRYNTAKYNYTQDLIRQKFVFAKTFELDESQYWLKPPKFRARQKYVYSFDIETYADFDPTHQIEFDFNDMQVVPKHEELKQYIKRALVPYGVCYQRVDLDQNKHSELHLFVGDGCLEAMMNHLFTTYPQEEPHLIFGHNAGRFDTILMKSCRNILFTSQLYAGGSIRSLEGVYKEEPTQTFRFLDSYSFTQLSLDMSSRALHCENKKAEFDIVDKSRNFFDTTEEWKDYLKQDVRVLTEILSKLEMNFRAFDQSITCNCGSASIAWKLIHFTCFNMRKQFLPKSPVVTEFILSSVYGGRILHYKKTFECTENNDGLISLDYNSLYPSAMCYGLYPIDRYKIMDPEQYEEHIKLKHLFIVECTLDGGNVKYPLVPYKTNEGNLVYRSDEFSGVYTSVDLVEALNLGYKIVKVTRGIYWRRSGVIFKDLINNLYNLRMEYKKQGNPLEYSTKILLNSGYGKFLEKITTYYVYDDEKRFKNSLELPNGQFETRMNFERKLINKPIQIGAFILSYARSCMNKIISDVGPENVWYGDTDSIYVPVNKIDKISLGPGLGCVKNDYGDNVFVKSAIFLDSKRYYLEFNDGRSKCKFNGLNFSYGNKTRGWSVKDYKMEADFTPKRIYEALRQEGTKSIDVIADKWRREGFEVFIDPRVLKFISTPDKRAQWEGDEFYPLGYDKTKPERPFTYDSDNCSFNEGYNSPQYKLTDNQLVSSLPLMGDEKNMLTKEQKFTSNFLFYQQDLYYSDSKKLYKMGAYCPSELITDKLEIENVNKGAEYIVTIEKREGAPNHNLNKKEVGRLLKFIANKIKHESTGSSETQK